MRERYLLVLAIASALAVTRAPEAAGQERIAFARGATSSRVSGSVKGDASKRYVIGAKAGQTLTIELKPSRKSLYYNVTKAGASAAMRIGSSETDNRWTTTLPSDGDYVIDVYFMRNEARRGTAASFTLDVVVGSSKPSH